MVRGVKQESVLVVGLVSLSIITILMMGASSGVNAQQ
jgi:hypothetical protein